MAPSRAAAFSPLLVARVLPLLHLGVAVAGAARVPSASEKIVGADLLIRTAETCDLSLAFRLFNSTSFRSASLMHPGSDGVTPLMAATRAGCAAMVAMIMLHPDFDDATVRRGQQRREIADFARLMRPAGHESAVEWALTVVQGIRAGKASQKDLERDPMQAVTDAVWFLPQPGEWRAPVSLEEMGVVKPELPAIPEEHLRDSARRGFVFSKDGARAEVDTLIKLWHLVVAHHHAKPDGDRQRDLAGHMRSIGWTIFFQGGRHALLSQSRFVDTLFKGPIDLHPTGGEVSTTLSQEELDEYHKLGDLLPFLWNKTGDWVLRPWAKKHIDT